jgi:isoleucyl-tRNA synthetase
MDLYSADALRFLFLSSPLLNGEDFSLVDKDVADIQRKLAMVWNMYDFFTLYAEVDKWEWNGTLEDPSPNCNNPFDIWILSRLHQLTAEVTTHMDSYDVPNALKAVLPFIDDASNWYVRRSRRRFWKSGDDADKQAAYQTLHYVLVRLAQVLAPFTPFLADELYQKLTGEESVHLTDWPQAGHVDELVTAEMSQVREYVTEALALRAEAKLKVRQPLARLGVPRLGEFVDFKEILRDEVNVKAVEQASELTLDTELTPVLKQEGQMREVIRLVQNARKKAGLQVDDRITLVLATPDELLGKAITAHTDTIASETLATSLRIAQDDKQAFHETAKADGADLHIGLTKSG